MLWIVLVEGNVPVGFANAERVWPVACCRAAAVQEYEPVPERLGRFCELPALQAALAAGEREG